jgi:hypothetical protein
MLAANQKALTALQDAKLELSKHDEGYSHLRHDNTLPTPIARDRPPSNKILGLRAAPPVTPNSCLPDYLLSKTSLTNTLLTLS